MSSTAPALLHRMMASAASVAAAIAASQKRDRCSMFFKELKACGGIFFQIGFRLASCRAEIVLEGVGAAIAGLIEPGCQAQSLSRDSKSGIVQNGIAARDIARAALLLSLGW